MHFDVLPTEGLHPELGLLFATWEDGTREWLENLEDARQANMTWSPFPNGHSIGGLMLHMMGCDLHWLHRAALGNEPDPTHPAVIYDETLDQDGVFWPTPPDEPFEWYYELYRANRQHSLEVLKSINDPLHLCKRPSGNEFTLRWILAHIVEHDSYHAGQMVLLNEMFRRSS